MWFHSVITCWIISVFEWDDIFSPFSQDLEVKSLLLEAYLKGQQELLYVVPFVAKVLESSLRSIVSKLLIVQTELSTCFCCYLISLLTIVSKPILLFAVLSAGFILTSVRLWYYRYSGPRILGPWPSWMFSLSCIRNMISRWLMDRSSHLAT